MELTLREYAYGSRDYKRALLLRFCVLNLEDSINDIAEEAVFGAHEGEKDYFFLGAFYGTDLVATLSLQQQEGCLVLRQFAVHEKQQGTGIGMKLIRFAHEYAKAKGFRRILLFSRMHVIDFYKKAGYTDTGKTHVYPEITLQEMYIDLE